MPSPGLDAISELLTDEKPHSRREMVGEVARAKRRGELPYSLQWFMSSEPILEVMRPCLEVQPEKRPSAQETIHAWEQALLASVLQYSSTDDKVHQADIGSPFDHEVRSKPQHVVGKARRASHAEQLQIIAGECLQEDGPFDGTLGDPSTNHANVEQSEIAEVQSSIFTPNFLQASGPGTHPMTSS